MKISNIIESRKIRLVLLSILIFSLPIAVFLSKQNQNFQQNAASGEVIDTLDYLLTDHPDKGLSGSHPLSQTIGSDFVYQVKWASDSYEYYTWDNNFIYLKEDHSGAPVQPYTFSPGTWMKRQMRVGESISFLAGENTIQFYDTHCNPTSPNSGPYKYIMTLENHIPNYNIGGDLGIQDVIVLSYDYRPAGAVNYEKYYYSKEWGWVRWENVDPNGKILQSVVFNKISSRIKPNPKVSCFAPNQTLPPDPPANGNSTPPPSSGNGTMIFQIQDQSGSPLDVNSGTLFVDNKSTDSDNFTLGGPSTQQCFTKIGAGKYKCIKPANTWYAGIGTTPSGYTVINGGNVTTPLVLGDGQTVTIPIVLSTGASAQPTQPPQAGAGVCGQDRSDRYQCICRTTGQNNSACLAQTAPWAASVPGDIWASCSPAKPQSFCDPSQAGSPPPATGGPGPATLIIEIKDKTKGDYIDAHSGNVFISAADGHDSDNYNLSGPTVQDQCSRIAVGKIKCTKYAADWYGGMSADKVTDGYSIFDAGITLGQDTALTVSSGGTITFTVLLTSLGAGPAGPGASNPTFVPNCLNVQGPTTITLGDEAEYLAQFDGPPDGELSGTIDAVKSTNSNPTIAAQWEWGGDGHNSSNWPPKALGYTNGSLSFKWKPEEVGVYQVFCRAINSKVDNSECRGPANTVDGPPRYWCKGPGASITVNVTAGGVDTPGSKGDMCEFATTVGGNVMQLGEGTNTQGPLVISAIAKPSINVKTYSFAFYNMDNQPADPKPIYFTANTPYIMTSGTNSITLPQDIFTKPDLNNAGAKASNIRIKSFFTDVDGVQSLTDPKCTVSIHAAGPTAIPIPSISTPMLVSG